MSKLIEQDTKTIEEEFKRFLKDVNIYDEYWNNYSKFSMGYSYEEITDPIKKFSQAFRWDNTQEGFDFWEEMSDRWINILQEEYKGNTIKSKLLKL